MAPDDGALPAVGARGCRRARVRRLPARAVLHGALRVLRLQHLHRDRAGRRREPARLRGHRAAARSRSPPTCCGPARTGRCSTVFVGGGTPTVLSVPDLARMLGGVRDAWGLADDVEVTTEANPDSVTPESLAALADAGFTRVSFGMQSAVPHVLATLDRTHDPRRIPDVVRWARDAGLAVSLDLIYGTPGESLDDWRTSVEAALATGVDHVSAYALVVEAGTRMAVQVRRGRARAARRRRPGREVRAGRRPVRGRRAALVRGEQLGAHARRRVPAQPQPTGGATTGGGSAPARTATSAACAGGTSSTRARTPTGSTAG